MDGTLPQPRAFPGGCPRGVGHVPGAARPAGAATRGACGRQPARERELPLAVAPAAGCPGPVVPRAWWRRPARLPARRPATRHAASRRDPSADRRGRADRWRAAPSSPACGAGGRLAGVRRPGLPGRRAIATSDDGSQRRRTSPGACARGRRRRLAVRRATRSPRSRLSGSRSPRGDRERVACRSRWPALTGPRSGPGGRPSSTGRPGGVRPRPGDEVGSSGAVGRPDGRLMVSLDSATRRSPDRRRGRRPWPGRHRLAAHRCTDGSIPARDGPRLSRSSPSRPRRRCRQDLGQPVLSTVAERRETSEQLPAR